MILSQLSKYVMADIEAGNSVLLRSDSGRGKSDFCDQLFDTLKEKSGLNIGFQTLFLATQCPPDLIGYIFKGERAKDNGDKYAVSEASLPLWMQSTEGKPAWEYDRFFLVLDEYGQGEVDVKRASAELLLKGKVGPWALPPYSIRIACTNQGARYGVTKDFDFVINRRSEYNLMDDLESWMTWADKPYKIEGKSWSVSPLMKAFAKTNPELLFEPMPDTQRPWCTPRSLCSVDRFLQMVEKIDGKVDPQNTALGEGIAAKVGVPVAGHLMSWLIFRVELPQYEEVVADPANTRMPNKPDQKMLMCYELAARTKKEHLPSVVAYIQRMEKDLAVAYVTSLCRRDKSMILEPAVSAWTAKNSTLMSVVTSLSR